LVRDDGIGGATANGGSGLAGLADRVHALDGSLTIETETGRGTTLTAELPCPVVSTSLVAAGEPA
jgi:signal transduction histidine kinase